MISKDDEMIERIMFVLQKSSAKTGGEIYVFN
jgi:hypothetical protein